MASVNTLRDNCRKQFEKEVADMIDSDSKKKL